MEDREQLKKIQRAVTKKLSHLKSMGDFSELAEQSLNSIVIACLRDEAKLKEKQSTSINEEADALNALADNL